MWQDDGCDLDDFLNQHDRADDDCDDRDHHHRCSDNHRHRVHHDLDYANLHYANLHND